MLHRQHNTHMFLYPKGTARPTGLVEEISIRHMHVRTVTSHHGARLGLEEDLLGKEEQQKQPNTQQAREQEGGYGRRLL